MHSWPRGIINFETACRAWLLSGSVGCLALHPWLAVVATRRWRFRLRKSYSVVVLYSTDHHHHPSRKIKQKYVGADWDGERDRSDRSTPLQLRHWLLRSRPRKLLQIKLPNCCISFLSFSTRTKQLRRKIRKKNTISILFYNTQFGMT